MVTVTRRWSFNETPWLGYDRGHEKTLSLTLTSTDRLFCKKCKDFTEVGSLKFSLEEKVNNGQLEALIEIFCGVCDSSLVKCLKELKQQTILTRNTNEYKLEEMLG